MTLLPLQKKEKKKKKKKKSNDLYEWKSIFWIMSRCRDSRVREVIYFERIELNFVM